MQVSKKIPFEDENVLMGVRALYVVSNAIIIGLYLYVAAQIKKKKGKPTSPRDALTVAHTHYRSHHSEVPRTCPDGFW